MGFRPRTEITSLFASLMGCLTASLSGRLTAFLPQITKPVGPVMATGVLTVARFVGKVGCYLLVASLSGRLRASLSGRLTAFLPPDHKADGSRHCDGGTHGGEICWESRMLPLGCESLGTPQGVPLGHASWRSTPQITKPAGPVIATGVLTVARFVGKVGSYLLVASLSGRLRASLSGRLTAFHPPDHKAGGSRHRDGGTHGGEICPSRELDDPLASQQPCRGLLGPEALPWLVGPPGAT